MRDQIDLMTKLVHDSLKGAQMKQKTWYDQNQNAGGRHASDAVADVFPQVVSSMARSYKVEKRVGKVNYVIDMHDRHKQKRVFHINILREFHSSSSIKYSMLDRRG